MDSSSDSDSNTSIDRAFKEELQRANEWRELGETHVEKSLNKGSCTSTLEWSRFMKSTAVMLQYMEEAKAESLDVCSLAPRSPHQEHKTPDGNVVEEAENERDHTPASSSVVVFSSGSRAARSESNPAVPPRLSPTTTNLRVLVEYSTEAFHPELSVSNAAEMCVQPVSTHSNDFEAPNRPGSAERLEAVARQPTIDGCISTPSTALLDGVPAECVRPSVSSAPGSPRRKAGLEPSSTSTAFNELDVGFVPIAGPATEAPALATSEECVFGDPSAVQNTPTPLVNAGDVNNLRVIASEGELQRDVLSFDATHASNCQQDVAVAEQMKNECACTQNPIPVITEECSHIDVMASLGEAEVERRVAREKARCVEARRQRREDNVRK